MVLYKRFLGQRPSDSRRFSINHKFICYYLTRYILSWFPIQRVFRDWPFIARVTRPDNPESSISPVIVWGVGGARARFCPLVTRGHHAVTPQSPNTPNKKKPGNNGPHSLYQRFPYLSWSISRKMAVKWHPILVKDRRFIGLVDVLTDSGLSSCKPTWYINIQMIVFMIKSIFYSHDQMWYTRGMAAVVLPKCQVVCVI